MARSRFAIAFTLIGTVLSSAAHALGLGAIETKSALNEPLDARIPLISAETGELESLAVALASANAFERAGVRRPFHLSRLKFEVIRGDRPYVHVTTEKPIKEPFLDFLVEANWPRGRLVREYTLLLDPPIYAPNPQTQAVTAPAPQAAPAQSRASATSARAEQAPTQIPVQSQGPREYGPVKSSDTLWKIANSLRPDEGVTVNQMMVALLQANPQAFIDGDINRLKRGAVLRVPERSVVTRLDAAAATAEVRQQMARWRQDQQPAEPAQSPQPTEQARLRVVAPSGSGGEQAASSLTDRELEPTTEAVNQLQRELTLSEESVAGLQAENEELKAQLEALKQQVSSLERVVNLEAEQPLPGQTQTAAEAQPVAEAQPAEAEPVQAPAAQPAAPAAEQPPMLDLVAEPRNLGILGGLAVVLAGLLALLFRRRRQGEPAPEASAAPAVVKAPEPLADEPEFEDEPVAQAAVPHADQMPLESDALGEAEVYLAYGRYDQARQVVAKALEQEPQRADLHLKLMEIMALTHDADGFENQARLLHEQVGADDPSWQQAQEMGREFLPNSPLFGQEDEFEVDASPVAVADEPATPESNELDFGEFAFDKKSAVLDEAPEPQAADDFSTDFDLDLAVAEPVPAENDLDFGLDPTAAAAPVESEDALDFGLDEPGELAQEPAVNVVEFTLPEDEANEQSLDSLEELDEAGTKLDLARAYLDMGDSEGARSLLDEVLAEGSAMQKRQAEDLLREIA
jgi:pilus assembly protein FimV